MIMLHLDINDNEMILVYNEYSHKNNIRLNIDSLQIKRSNLVDFCMHKCWVRSASNHGYILVVNLAIFI